MPAPPRSAARPRRSSGRVRHLARPLRHLARRRRHLACRVRWLTCCRGAALRGRGLLRRRRPMRRCCWRRPGRTRRWCPRRLRCWLLRRGLPARLGRWLRPARGRRWLRRPSLLRPLFFWCPLRPVACRARGGGGWCCCVCGVWLGVCGCGGVVGVGGRVGPAACPDAVARPGGVAAAERAAARGRATGLGGHPGLRHLARVADPSGSGTRFAKGSCAMQRKLLAVGAAWALLAVSAGPRWPVGVMVAWWVPRSRRPTWSRRMRRRRLRPPSWCR